MLLDEVMPRYDVTLAETVVVRAPTDVAFAAARHLDFLRVRTPLLVAAIWVRDAPRRLFGGAAPPPPSMVLPEPGEPMALPGWLVVAEDDHEVVFGAVGRFWQPRIEWRDVDRADFAAFDEPGWGRIAANFSVRPYGDGTSLVTYECRTATTDDDARARFARYWTLIRPFVGHVVRATLRTIQTDAERAGS